MKTERMLIMLPDEPTSSGMIPDSAFTILASDEWLIEMDDDQGLAWYLTNNEIKAPPSPGLWVLECKMEKDEDAPSGIRTKLIRWRLPTHEEIDGILATQVLEKSKSAPPSSTSWTFSKCAF
jgi:hypothetical protein